MKRWLPLFLVLLLAGLACEDEPTEPIICKCGDPPPGDLTELWHVLYNFGQAYTERRLDMYDELLDVNFTFYFDEDDVGVPAQWGRAEELEAVGRLFDAGLNEPGFARCKHIELDLLDEKDVTWVEMVPDAFPDEVWYTANVFYDFLFEIEPDLTVVPFLGSKAQFVVRNAGDEEAPRWRLVEVRDLGAFGSARLMTGLDQSTLGGVTSLYQ